MQPLSDTMNEHLDAQSRLLPQTSFPFPPLHRSSKPGEVFPWLSRLWQPVKLLLAPEAEPNAWTTVDFPVRRPPIRALS